MDSIKICMIGLVCVFLSLLLKEMKSGFAAAVKIACSVFVIVCAVSILSPAVEFAKNTVDNSTLSSYASILFKALGIALVSQISADICRDCAEGALASNIELVGKAEIILLCLPIIKEIIDLAGDIMG